MKILIVIPARMESSRFPGKPLKKINGIPMIEMIYKKLNRSRNKDHDLYVATCNYEIHSHIISIGGRSIMTSKKHKRATDRCSEALDKIEIKEKCKYDLVIMVQGDEPLVNNKMIKQSITPFKLKDINVVNLMGEISKKEFLDEDCIKVVTNKFNNALYFSRKPIPYLGKLKGGIFKQICIITFRKIFLKKYIKMKPTPLEILESIDMLRILENGYNIKMIKTNEISIAVDRTKDIKKVENFLNQN